MIDRIGSSFSNGKEVIMYIYKDEDEDELLINIENDMVEVQLTDSQGNYVINFLPYKELPELIMFLQEAYDANNQKNNKT